MSNFRLYSGLFVTILEDYKGSDTAESLKAGQVLQVMHVKYAISFVGVNGSYEIGNVKLAPVRPS